MANENETYTPEDQVQPEDACPECGERRMDYLVWIADGERVKCQTCGHEYQP